MPHKKKTHIIFFGDSITELAVRPGGYIARMDSMLTAHDLSASYQLTGSGVSGNKIYDLYLRLEDDVISKKPDMVVIYIGVNDVWHKRSLRTGTDADKFERFYNAIIKKLQSHHIKVILCTPAFIGEKTNMGNEQDAELNLYCDIIRNIAAQNSLPLVDLRTTLTAYDQKNNPGNDPYGILTADGVHLNAMGNELVAEEMWKAVIK